MQGDSTFGSKIVPIIPNIPHILYDDAGTTEVYTSPEAAPFHVELIPPMTDK